MGEIAARMEAERFLTRDQIEDDTDNMGIAHATDLIWRSLSGEQIFNANDMIEVHTREQEAGYRQSLIDEAVEKEVKLKKNPAFLKVEELEAALAEHEGKRQARVDALDEELAAAFQEAEKVLGDRLADIILPRDEGRGQSEESWYRDTLMR